MSRVDDRIRARLQMQVVLRGIAVLMIGAGAALSLVWLLWPAVEGLLRPSHSVLAPSYDAMLRERAGLVSFGLCSLLPGALLLMMTDWLAQRWVPIRENGMCPECDYPRDDMERKSCPDCGHVFYRERATVEATPGDAYRAEG